MMKMMIITYGNRLTYSSKPVWRDDEFALVSSDAEFPISVVLPTLNLQIHTMFAHTPGFANHAIYMQADNSL